MQSINIDFPYQFNTRGRTATADEDDHIRDMMHASAVYRPW